jgi:hypothetical protein
VASARSVTCSTVHDTAPLKIAAISAVCGALLHTKGSDHGFEMRSKH